MKIIFLCLLVGLTLLMAKLNINQATRAELIHIKGIGKSTADKIIKYRKQHKFQSIEELMKIKGIGKKRFKKLRHELTF